jgi:hypothetical protein
MDGALIGIPMLDPIVGSLIFGESRIDRHLELACSMLCVVVFLDLPKSANALASFRKNDLRLLTLRKPLYASRLWSASTYSNLGSFRQNSLMPGFDVTCRCIEFGFVRSKLDDARIQRHRPTSIGVGFVWQVFLIAADAPRQSFTPSLFTRIDDLIARHHVSSTFPNNMLIQFAF